jgi:hypothetical protein
MDFNNDKEFFSVVMLVQYSLLQYHSQKETFSVSTQNEFILDKCNKIDYNHSLLSNVRRLYDQCLEQI